MQLADIVQHMKSSDSHTILIKLLDVFVHASSGKAVRYNWTRVNNAIALVATDGSLLTMKRLAEVCQMILARIERSIISLSQSLSLSKTNYEFHAI